MNEQDQWRAIAETCGWEVVACGGTLLGWPPGCPHDYPLREVPKFTRDLNAMHGVEKTLYCKENYGHAASAYFCWLLVVTKECCEYAEARCEPVSSVNHNEVISATAAQRAEAFLRTVGKWKE